MVHVTSAGFDWIATAQLAKVHSAGCQSGSLAVCFCVSSIFGWRNSSWVAYVYLLFLILKFPHLFAICAAQKSWGSEFREMAKFEDGLDVVMSSEVAIHDNSKSNSNSRNNKNKSNNKSTSAFDLHFILGKLSSLTTKSFCSPTCSATSNQHPDFLPTQLTYNDIYIYIHTHIIKPMQEWP